MSEKDKKTKNDDTKTELKDGQIEDSNNFSKEQIEESSKEELKTEEKEIRQIQELGEELPDSIKERLEQRKKERAKKKLIKKKRKKTEQKSVKVGKAFINASYNNTIVTLTDINGNVISWASAGVAGFKGPKKATPYAAQIITKIAVLKAKEEYGLEEVSVFISGVGTGRESAVRALNANGIEISVIKDITPIPHNGCRPPRPRRV